MLSCKKCGAQMSGIDLVCKNCGTPWGKKHKSREGIFFSILLLTIAAGIAYVYYIPGVKENFFKFYNNVFAIISSEKKVAQNMDEPSESEQQENDTIPEDSTIIDTPSEDIVSENTSITEDTPSEPIEYGPPAFSWVSTSSTLVNYPVSNTTDKDLRTAWLEGVKGNGINEWVIYSSEKNQKISSITLYNGYLKNDKVYLNNGRIKKLSIEFSDGEIITRDLENASFYDAKKGYVITFEKPRITTSVKLTILDVYQGSYYTDTGFSEIEFN